MTDHSTLERRLHDASDPALWDDVSPDAWQQNERRLAADRSHRAGQRLRVVAAAAAVVVVVGGGVLVMSQLDGASPPNSSGGTKDGGSKDAGSKDQDPFKPDNLVGKLVVLERFRANGAPVEHSAFLTRAGGKGLSLCDLYKGPNTVSSSAGSGSCTASSPDPAEPKTNAFRFVTGTEGSDDLKGVTGAVEPRVASLKAWVGDSAVSRPVPLHALGVKGLQAFGITTAGSARTRRTHRRVRRRRCRPADPRHSGLHRRGVAAGRRHLLQDHARADNGRRHRARARREHRVCDVVRVAPRHGRARRHLRSRAQA